MLYVLSLLLIKFLLIPIIPVDLAKMYKVHSPPISYTSNSIATFYNCVCNITNMGTPMKRLLSSLVASYMHIGNVNCLQYIQGNVTSYLKYFYCCNWAVSIWRNKNRLELGMSIQKIVTNNRLATYYKTKCIFVTCSNRSTSTNNIIILCRSHIVACSTVPWNGDIL